MKIAVLLTLNLLLGFISPCLTFGQVTDTATQKPLQHALTLYAETIGEESHLYNGPQYINYVKNYVNGHQFYQTDDDAPGGIYYDGAWYAGVPLLYDILQDKIILDHPVSEFKLSLVSEKVKYFTFLNHTFIYLGKDKLAGSSLKTGFYDLLHDGNLKLLVKRTKEIQEEPTRQGMTGHFNLITKFYLLKENIYYPVKKKKSILKALPDKKKELQRYAREQKLNFRKNREKAILQLIQYYEHLNK